jgi:hypothetical protein
MNDETTERTNRRGRGGRGELKIPEKNSALFALSAVRKVFQEAER